MFLSRFFQAFHSASRRVPDGGRAGPGVPEVQLDPAEATEARLVPYADVLERLRTDPTYIKPSDAYAADATGHAALGWNPVAYM